MARSNNCQTPSTVTSAKAWRKNFLPPPKRWSSRNKCKRCYIDTHYLSRAPERAAITYREESDFQPLPESDKCGHCLTSNGVMWWLRDCWEQAPPFIASKNSFLDFDQRVAPWCSLVNDSGLKSRQQWCTSSEILVRTLNRAYSILLDMVEKPSDFVILASNMDRIATQDDYSDDLTLYGVNSNVAITQNFIYFMMIFWGNRCYRFKTFDRFRNQSFACCWAISRPFRKEKAILIVSQAHLQIAKVLPLTLAFENRSKASRGVPVLVLRPKWALRTI